MAINIEVKWTPLDKLIKITLSGCRSSCSIPMLDHLPHLRVLFLLDMDNLTCLRSSLGECDNVIRSTYPLSPSLRLLRLRNMEKLEKWIDGEINSSKMISPVLESLEIKNYPKITLLDECHPHPLVSLRISFCKDLVSIKSVQGLTSLVSLDIYNCPSFLGITKFPNQCHSLKTLSITDCRKLTSLSRKIFDCFGFLNELKLGPFSKDLDSFPSIQGIEKLGNHLQSLELEGWDHRESLPQEIQHLTSLTRLTIRGFPVSTKSIQGLVCLDSLVIERCPSLLGITNLPNHLKTLKIIDCYRLTSLPPKMFDSFSFLKMLELGPFSEELRYFPSLQGIEKLANHLQSLELCGLFCWDSLPQEIQHLHSLTQLTITHFGIRELPVWLTNMSSIQYIWFKFCNNLDKETVKRGAPQEASYVKLNDIVLKR